MFAEALNELTVNKMLFVRALLTGTVPSRVTRSSQALEVPATSTWMERGGAADRSLREVFSALCDITEGQNSKLSLIVQLYDTAEEKENVVGVGGG